VLLAIFSTEVDRPSTLWAGITYTPFSIPARDLRKAVTELLGTGLKILEPLHYQTAHYLIPFHIKYTDQFPNIVIFWSLWYIWVINSACVFIAVCGKTTYACMECCGGAEN
jgi:hypothetical protein